MSDGKGSLAQRDSGGSKEKGKEKGKIFLIWAHSTPSGNWKVKGKMKISQNFLCITIYYHY